MERNPTYDPEKSTFLRAGNETVQVYYKDVYFIEGMKDYVRFHLEKEKHIVYHTLKSLIDKLPDDFLRVHQSYIVNVNKIEKIKDNQIHIQDKRIPISKSYRSCLKSRIDQNTL